MEYKQVYLIEVKYRVLNNHTLIKIESRIYQINILRGL